MTSSEFWKSTKETAENIVSTIKENAGTMHQEHFPWASELPVRMTFSVSAPNTVGRTASGSVYVRYYDPYQDETVQEVHRLGGPRTQITINTGGNGFLKTGEVLVKPIDDRNLIAPWKSEKILRIPGPASIYGSAVNGVSASPGFFVKKIDTDNTPEKREAYEYLDSIPKQQLDEVKNYLRGFGTTPPENFNKIPKEIRKIYFDIRATNLQKLYDISAEKRRRIEEAAKYTPEIFDRTMNLEDAVARIKAKWHSEGSILTPRLPKSQRALVQEQKPHRLMSKGLINR